MRKLQPLAIALPAFLLGCLATASLTTVARAQTKPTANKPFPMYRIVTDETTMNRYADEGYRVKSSSSNANWTNYLMER